MKKVFVLSVWVMWFALNAQFLLAQSDEKRFEVGGQFSTIRLTTIPFQFGDYTKGFQGGGGRFGFNATSRFGLEAEMNFFPQGNDFPGLGDRTQALFGVKIAIWRGKKLAFYGKARPGVMQIGRLLDCPSVDIGSCNIASRKGLALDLGGIVEYNYTKRFFMRVDVGDTLIRQKRRNIIQVFPEAPGGFLRGTVQSKTVNNLQISVGVGFRF